MGSMRFLLGIKEFWKMRLTLMMVFTRVSRKKKKGLKPTLSLSFKANSFNEVLI
jgi:hypothetical protein